MRCSVLGLSSWNPGESESPGRRGSWGSHRRRVRAGCAWPLASRLFPHRSWPCDLLHFLASLGKWGRETECSRERAPTPPSDFPSLLLRLLANRVKAAFSCHGAGRGWATHSEAGCPAPVFSASPRATDSTSHRASQRTWRILPGDPTGDGDAGKTNREDRRQQASREIQGRRNQQGDAQRSAGQAEALGQGCFGAALRAETERRKQEGPGQSKERRRLLREENCALEEHQRASMLWSSLQDSGWAHSLGCLRGLCHAPCRPCLTYAPKSRRGTCTRAECGEDSPQTAIVPGRNVSCSPLAVGRLPRGNTSSLWSGSLLKPKT